EWDRFICYASVGGRIDFNVNGKQTYRLAEAQEEREESFSVDSRMKNVLVSFNGKLGLSYPIGKVFSLYSEAGIAYYLKNNSEIKTYYLKHPFMVDFNVGLRLGF
ncbi:MAG: PorT family protein, partial [Massilibacteroides sp.]|nr:PorT family protein [Massilibacteroides sp.]